MDLEDFFPPLQIRQFYRYTAVKTPGTGQCRIKRFRTVGSRQNNDTAVSLKTIHFRQKLIQSLLPFIIAAHTAGISLLSDRINLIDKNNTRSFFLCLFKEVTNLAGAHAHKHFHKLRSAHGKERYICFTCYCLCKHRLSCSGRSHKQNTFGHGCAYFPVLVRIMQIFYNLRQIFFCLVLTCHIRKHDAVRRFHIDLGIALSHVEHHGIGSAALFVHQLPGHELPDCKEDDQRQYPCQQNRKKW